MARRVFVNISAYDVLLNTCMANVFYGYRHWELLFIYFIYLFIYHLILTQGTILSNHTTKQKRKKEIQSIVKTKCYNTTSCTNVVWSTTKRS